MVAPLLTGLGKILAGNAPKKVARKFIKKISKDKVKSTTKNKKDNKISKDSSVLASNSSGNIETKLYSEESNVSSLQKLKIPILKIKSAPRTDSPIQQLKTNLTNIHSFLVNQNNQKNKLQKENEKLIFNRISKQKKKLKEKKIESPIKSSLGKVKNSTIGSPSGGSIFEKLFEFIGIIISGIIVNGLPNIIEKFKEIIDNVVNFLTPIQSGFNLIKGFFTGDLDQKEYDVDRKRFDGALESFQADGGLVDQFAEKMGPLEGIIKQLKPFIGMLREQVKGKNIVLAKKDGKEGILNTETKKFIAKEWTSAEREKMGGEGGEGSSPATESSSDREGDTVTSGGATNANIISGFPITSHFGGRWGKLHGGIDVGTPTGTPLSITHPGTIMYAGLQSGGYGNMIDAWVPELNVQFRFAHLVNLFKKTGDKFKANEILAETGGGAGDIGRGSSTGPHLHYEIDTKKNGTTYGGAKNRNLLYDMAKHVILGTSSSSSDGEGGSIIPKIKGNMPSDEVVERISHSTISDQNVSTHYYNQPYDTVQYQIIPFSVPMKKNSSNTEKSELNSIWMK